MNRLTDIKLNGDTNAAVHMDYDDLSRRTLLSYENGSQCAYAYEINDDLSSLAETFVGSSVSFNFDYNKVHQQIGLAVDDSAFLWTPQLSSITNYANANDLNQYPAVDATGYAYNNNGCLTGGLLTAGFDALNRMTQAVSGLVTNDYVYDPVNRQAQKAVNTVKTGFLYDGQQLIEEYDDAGDLACRYIRGNRLDEVFIKLAGSTKTYLHHDRLGSVIALSDDSGAVLQAYSYSPFGQTAILAGTAFGYTGQRYDSEVGLYNYKARVYAPAIGRFLQPDPIGFDAGDLNLYAYINNDSVNSTDSFGLAPGTGDDYGANSSSISQTVIGSRFDEYGRPIRPITPDINHSWALVMAWTRVLGTSLGRHGDVLLIDQDNSTGEETVLAGFAGKVVGPIIGGSLTSSDKGISSYLNPNNVIQTIDTGDYSSLQSTLVKFNAARAKLQASLPWRGNYNFLGGGSSYNSNTGAYTFLQVMGYQPPTPMGDNTPGGFSGIPVWAPGYYTYPGNPVPAAPIIRTPPF